MLQNPLGLARNLSPKPNSNSGKKTVSISARRKHDALEMAYILYDIYKEKQYNTDVKVGRNGANISKNG